MSAAITFAGFVVIALLITGFRPRSRIFSASLAIGAGATLFQLVRPS